MRFVQCIVLASALLVTQGCSEEAPAGGASASATQAPTASAKPAPAATSAASSAAAPAQPRGDCPKDSAGPGTQEQPCVGKGTARMMDAKWTNKIDDKGPYFSIKNISPKPILYGKLVVYFYDKAGKQLDVQIDGAPAKYKTCTGKIFQGPMKVDEKATLTFSCLKKEDVPKDAAAIEAELQVVGFADSTEKNVEFFWSNRDLTPEARPKGGVK